MKKILLHICCAPDATHTVQYLRSEGFSITGVFYNPCIHPSEEYNLRKAETMRLAREMDFVLLNDSYEPETWFNLVRGMEDEPEGGGRCELCYGMRLEKTAEIALFSGHDAFTTTLTISPHKKAEVINRAGEKAENKYGIEFLSLNLKKKDGFKISLQMSRKYHLYRQNYCGCVYSMRK